MKRIVFVLGFLFVIGVAFSAPVLIVTQKPTLAWDAVTKDANGNAFPAGATVSYDVLWQPVGGGAATLITNVITTSAALSLAPWAFFDLGVRTVLVYQGNTITSPVVWGSVSGTPNPFSVLSGAAPSGVSSVRIQ